MTVNEILDKVNGVDETTNYWFVRTTYGEHFNEFTAGSYIAIGWDYFTIDELINNTPEYVKNKIALHEQLDVANSKDKGKVTAAYNKINTFLNLRKNDIVVVPSRNSWILAFGRVADDVPYEVADLIADGTHFKRRKIEWIATKGIRELNPIFYQVKANQHSISNINRFAPYIDKIIGDLFKKGDETHFVLNIEKNENINFEDLRTLMDSIDALVNDINEEFQFNDNLDEFFVKINVQSKGALELIKAGKSLAILAFLLSAVSCGTLDEQDDPEIVRLINKNRDHLERSRDSINSLEVDMTKLNNLFSNGR